MIYSDFEFYLFIYIHSASPDLRLVRRRNRNRVGIARACVGRIYGGVRGEKMAVDLITFGLMKA